MSLETPTNVPPVLYLGDTWVWTRSVDGVSAAEYSAVWYFYFSGGQFSVSATASGADFAVSVAKTTTSGYTAGTYRWEMVVTATSGGARTVIDRGFVEVRANPASGDAVDWRSSARITLDAIEATIQGRASTDQQSMSINGRSLSRMPIADLILLRDKYAGFVRQEENAERIAAGKPSKGRLMVRFTR